MEETNDEREVNIEANDDDETEGGDEDIITEDQIPAIGKDKPKEEESEESDDDSEEDEVAEDDDGDGDDSAESSPEETADEEEVEETSAESDDPSISKKPAPVEGETPREKALRLEVQRMKHKLRERGMQDLADPSKAAPQKPNEDEVQELRDLGYSDQEISNMEKAIDVIAKKKGYVKAEDNYQKEVNAVVNGFINEHPEYKPENDPEDVRWNRFDEIIKSGVYNTAGKSPEQLQVIFGKVHKDVVEELGEPTASVERKRQNAQEHKIKSISRSGGTKSSASKQTPAKKAAAVDPEVRSFFKGFDDEDLEE